MSYVPVFISFKWDVVFFTKMCYVPDLKVALYDTNSTFTIYSNRLHVLPSYKLPKLVVCMEKDKLVALIEKNHTKQFWSLLEKDPRVQKAMQHQNRKRYMVHTILFLLLIYFSFFQ